MTGSGAWLAGRWRDRLLKKEIKENKRHNYPCSWEVRLGCWGGALPRHRAPGETGKTGMEEPSLMEVRGQEICLPIAWLVKVMGTSGWEMFRGSLN